MKFKFDEEKLKINNPDLGVELLTELLDDICLNTRFICEYELPEDESTVGTLLILSARFDKQSWLYPNLKSWKVFEDGEEQDALRIMTEE